MKRPVPINEERILSADDFIVSKTDTRGIIQYVNRIFIDISKYTETELIGMPHSLVRHPDMPKAAFLDLWTTIKKGKEWRGLVKNLCKDGAYYWVDAYVVPNKDSKGNIIGFTSMRRKPNEIEIKNIIPIYHEMLRKENQ